MRIIDIIKKNLTSVIIVLAVFALMVSVSFMMLQGMLQRQLLKCTESEIQNVDANIRLKLAESEVTLVNASAIVKNILENGGANGDVLVYFVAVTEWLTENGEKVSGFNGLYGYVNGEYLDGTMWNPYGEHPDFVPTERPWYKAAVEAKDGEIGFSPPYVDPQTGKTVISASMEVGGGGGAAYGVIAVDINITSLSEYVRGLEFADGGYGILLDGDLNVIAHRDRGLVGGSLESAGGSYPSIAKAVRERGDVSNLRVTDVDGVEVIVFVRKLFNGCYLGIFTPRESYNRDLNYTGATLAALGLVFAAAMILLLMRFSVAKMVSDKESQSKTTFLARMSHEIRTPMNAIIGMSELMLRSDLPPNVYENAVNIKNAGANLLSIVNDILDFSKIESGTLEIAEDEYSLASVINDVMGIIRMRMTGRAVRLMIDIDPKIPGKLIGDEVKIRQIMLNLLSNAVKYTKEGLITFNLTGETNGGSVTMYVKVTDSGIGIRDEDLKKLFGDFVQVDTAKHRGAEGTGLGLAITRSFCRAMGGDIDVESEYGKGSTFTARLPQKFVEYVPFAEVKNPEKKLVLFYGERRFTAGSIIRSLDNLGVKYVRTDSISEVRGKLSGFTHIFLPSFRYGNITAELKNLKNPPAVVLFTDISENVVFRGANTLTIPAHVLSVANALDGVQESHGAFNESGEAFVAPEARALIVDDITANLLVADGLLAHRGVKSDSAKRGVEAIDLIKNNVYDIVFMDHMMPEMDGIEATSGIRKLDGDYFKNLPIIALTANAVSGMREMFLENGMNDFLAKPIEPSKLDDILKKWLPPEKILEGAAAEEISNESAGEFLNMMGKISGVSAERALAYAGGSEAMCESNVRMIAGMLPEQAEKLPGLIDTDLPLYAIQVHGLKNMLGNIGAYQLAERAQELENFAKAGEHEACREMAADFLNDISRLITELEALTAAPEEKKIGDADEFYGALPKIKEAAEMFDSALSLEILSELRNCSFGEENDKIIESLNRAFEHFDFDEAADILNEINAKREK
ncbi:MAG: response regulator [Oscillospiraceae bacterium]|jgi:signal transduction histidine kinase/DNA-binding NarL/FixJ family response regulator/HPt (histidine-containing phosphotransfer) domain-containing protein|nr:response regulator [Oscillospiraceae bacterium]